MTPNEFLQNPPKAITLFPDPVLLVKAQPVTDYNPWKQISEIMLTLMVQNRGCGLAAPQVGMSCRAFVMNTGKNPMAIINPEIVEYGDRLERMIEGCLSLPGEMVEMERPRRVKVKYTDERGKERKATFEGMTARCFQHEFDHLEGLLINRKKFPRPAVWYVGGADVPVTLTGSLGRGPDGDEYFSIVGSNTGIPAKQVKNLTPAINKEKPQQAE